MDSATTEKNCVLCCQDVDIFAFGKCDHPVCYRCSTKMRVLCEQKYCAVCREELDKVVFMRTPAAFSTLPHQSFPCEKKHDIYFGDEKIYAQFRHLLLPQCAFCSETKVFSKFEELEQHMRKQHEVFCCKLCLKHLKIFSHERKWYNRKELARHRAHGDPDDTSHRGHPLCRFCDDRYLDNDELLKHLRRDHYFCHFCDADGSQEYYSDYRYLSEHFRESHYLCEEGRCATEQFTHAFRTEIDYKAHKAAAHSKNRAEARQNRHIDLEFTFAPRQQRRNEGEDYDDMRHIRGGRGRPQGGQRSWRYSRDEEDRELAAAMRASMATRRQEERVAMQERSAPKHIREERPVRTEVEPKPLAGPIKPPVKTMKSKSPGDGEDDFPALGGAIAPLGMKTAPPSVTPAARALKEDDFPSLLAVQVSTPMTPAYSGQPKKSSSFQDEDFPALVSKIRPQKSTTGANSAWSGHTAPAKPSAQPAPSAKPASSTTTGPRTLPSSASSSSRRKKKVGDSTKTPSTRSLLSSDEDEEGMTQQEFRSVPTMLDISSLLTVKSANSKLKPNPPNPPNPPGQTPSTDVSKACKKKKQQKTPAGSSAGPSTQTGSSVAMHSASVETVAQKENVPQKTRNKPPGVVPLPVTGGLANGFTEKLQPKTKEPFPVTSHPTPDPPPDPEEEFPALMTKKPPPGFKSSFPLKASSAAPSDTLPTSPPGLSTPAAKPPPGFTGIPLNSNVSDSAPSAVNPPLKASASGYLVPDNFHQRNLELIQSIRKYLNNDESKFNQFKNLSAQFRQGVITAAQYHHSCKDLLGDDFNRIFNELLVLLPDTVKQQELLSAHGDCRALEKQSKTGGGKRNKKNAWQAPASGGNAAAELDCQVCQVCRQVLALKDFNTHKTMHMRDNEDFPSLQSISRIIS